MEIIAASILLIPHISSFLANGYKMNDMSNAKAKGTRMGLAKIKIAKIEITVAMTKNSF